MKPASIEELQDLIRSQECVMPLGAGSKTALVTPREGVVPVYSTGLSGLLEYQPEEFTFTALAGTRLAEVENVLAEHGQYLMFDPLLSRSGATLGGTVAAGLSGPGRYRYGGVRDALLGVKFVDGQGNLVRAGGKVVKNAAGFDLPKFMVGSLGGCGYLVELSFKVMPSPAAWATLLVRYPALALALEALVRLTRQPLEIYALDMQPDNNGQWLLVVRLGGAVASLPARLERLRSVLGKVPMDTLEGDAEHGLWRSAVEFSWVPPGWSLVKVPLTPKRVLALDGELMANGARRVYSVGANLAWVAWQGDLDTLDAILTMQELSGLVILGAAVKPRLGLRNGDSFARRIKQALDPQGKFPTL
jgi:glycolate oxidase FAD binding subunit